MTLHPKRPYFLSPRQITKAVICASMLYLLAYSATHAILDHVNGAIKKWDAKAQHWVYEDVAPSELIIDPNSKWVGSVSHSDNSNTPVYQFFLWSEILQHDNDNQILRPSIKIVIHEDESLVVVDWDTPVEGGAVELTFGEGAQSTTKKEEWTVSEDREITQAQDAFAILQAMKKAQLIEVVSRAYSGNPLFASFDTQGLSEFMNQIMNSIE